MPTWLWIAIVVVGVLAAGLLRERWRLNGLSKWCRQRGFVLHAPFEPGAQPPMASLVGRCNAHGARRWGAGVSGTVDGVALTCSEHETTEPGRKAGLWHTIVAWPIGGTAGPIVLWPKAHGPLDETLAALTGGSSEGQVSTRLGITATDPGGLRLVTPAGLLVEGDPAVRANWLTPERQRALEAWAHGGAFVVDDGHAAWRTRGLLDPARLEALLHEVPAARRMLE